MTELEICGLEVFGRHGVNEDERERAQPFVYDLWLAVHDPQEDAIDATVDYRRVREIVEEVSESRHFELLESLAAAVADRISGELAVERVRVRVRKPGVLWALYAAAAVERP